MKRYLLILVSAVCMTFIGVKFEFNFILVPPIVIIAAVSYLLGFNDMKHIKKKTDEV